MSRKELASQLGLSEKALEGFSDETLNEMAQEAVEGGSDFNLFCPSNDCHGGNCHDDY